MIRKQQHFLIWLVAMALMAAVQVWAQKPEESKPGMENNPMHQKHMEEMNKRGNHAMGFDQTKTTHHFTLLSDGGAIQVEAKDPKDTASRDQVRLHLSQIAKMFAAGDFSIPLAVHAQAPSGVETMKRLKAEINYKYEEAKNGGRVRISTANQEAVAAVHEFLKFQITEHQTGDSLKVQ
ncbi:MAG: hypothetical protein LAO31_14040 [Acidobacteriia bacterium]|nr:hypothetical protein [Terriglobia bacterium]